MKLGGVRVAAQILDPFLDAELASRGLTDRDLALVGISQGTMMSLHVGPRRPNRIGGILGFSGALIAPPLLAEETRSKPPVFLVHGTADQVVPFGASRRPNKPCGTRGSRSRPNRGRAWSIPSIRSAHKKAPCSCAAASEPPPSLNDKQMKSTGWQISTSCGFRPALYWYCVDIECDGAVTRHRLMTEHYACRHRLKLVRPWS